jgi:predicted ferric reductase
VVINLKDRWSGHVAGQFAFLTFNRSEGPHPFTISSAWNEDGKLTFLIKGLGDYTDTLPATLKAGDLVKVEGPYGRFAFDDNKSRQIWVAGGIGITPFIARMQALAEQADAREIDLFYSTAAPDEDFIAKVQASADKAGVRLHILRSDADGRLSADRVCAAVPAWSSASVWFCGPKISAKRCARICSQKVCPAMIFIRNYLICADSATTKKAEHVQPFLF